MLMLTLPKNQYITPGYLDIFKMVKLVEEKHLMSTFCWVVEHTIWTQKNPSPLSLEFENF